MRPEVEDCTLNNDEQNLEATNLCKIHDKVLFSMHALGGSKAVQISISSEQGGRSLVIWGQIWVPWNRTSVQKRIKFCR